ncbi:excinuclease ABC subunit UvrA [Candidatus Gottesmanbacteria bacterium]|nr:excinuclease ABC subunit UvrA [Candidatus Gottesmanbacteria bacterium]
MKDTLIIKGARQHNLKNVDLELPKNKFIVFSGISGSGKSSLAFDTIYAEGQRRYVESLSSYARQFLGVSNKPDVDFIEGLSPAISIDQKSTSHNPRSTVGTVTEIYDYMRLLFARIGHPHCPICGREISKQSPQQIRDLILGMLKMRTKSTTKPVRAFILAPVIRDRKGEFTKLFERLKNLGYTKARIDGKIYDLSEEFVLIKTNKHTIEVVVDTLSIAKKQLTDAVSQKTIQGRIFDSVTRALAVAGGSLILSFVSDASFSFPTDPKKFEDHLFSERFACPVDNISLSEIEPRSFSFNSPHGACPECSGIGTLLKINPDSVLNPRLSITEGGILPLGRTFEKDTWYSRLIVEVCLSIGINPRDPISAINEAQKQYLLYGTSNRIYTVFGTNRFGRETEIEEVFIGIIPELERRYIETDSDYVRTEIEKYMFVKVCPLCGGTRLKKEALSITILDKSIAGITGMSIEKGLDWVKRIVENKQILNEREAYISSQILAEIRLRLEFLASVGLTYITLDRAAHTLAGGEAQRIRLASQIGSGLTGVLYVLDEPSIGLHQKDNNKLIDTLKKLRDLGNTVIVVEHDRDTIEASDLVVDFGPQAGERGGKIIAKGSPREISKDPTSITGLYLSGKKTIKPPKDIAISENLNSLVIYGCGEQNLKNIDVTIPLGKMVCITGLSGSGKSTFLETTLYHILMKQFNPYHKTNPGKYRKVEGLENLDKVVMIDQSPIGRTPRSNPATYTGLFTFIRQLYSETTEARALGFGPGHFSFNVKGGRCEGCCGEGQIKIEMQFMSDIFVTCEVCGGKRYNSATLDVHYKGKNIADVLNMTVTEAGEFFHAISPLKRKLETLSEVGLSYIKLGQPAPTLSGGEAQRVKLASELSKQGTGHTIYLLDEPTTGLHFADLDKLLTVFYKLVSKNNTVVVIEHNLDIIKNSQHIIDLGPEGGDKGGYIVASGTPQEIAANPKSYTGEFLKKNSKNG